MFSGGESQKISIARAFFKSGDVFITDEPTSSLDPISELEIYNKLINEVNNKFVILITHRMSSCKDCEEILVIDKGKIIEKGNHVELIQKEGVYFNLWNSQAKLYNIL
jgi:ATP-binding cassette subfamily B protein